MSPTTAPVAALDVGHSRVLALIGQAGEDGQLVVKGVGLAPLDSGLKDGHVVDLKKVVEAIKEAVQEAETLAKTLMEKAWVGVNSASVVGRITTTTLHLGARPRPVTAQDLDRLWEAVHWQNLPLDHQVLNVLPHDFVLDDQANLVNPEGMEGSRLSMNALVLSCQKGAIRTLEKAVNQAGVEVEGFLFSPVAASLAVLTPEERRLGALLVDLGHATTGYALWHEDHLWATGTVPLGSSMVDHDLVHFFTTTFSAAEEAKKNKLTLLLDMVDEEEVVSLPTLAGERRNVSRKEACRVAAARVVELLQIVGLNWSGQVTKQVQLLNTAFCGGGSHLDGIETQGAAVFGCPSRLGDPLAFTDETQCLVDPAFPRRAAACALGLLHYGLQTSAGTVGFPSARSAKRKALLHKLLGLWRKEVSHDHI